MNFVYSVFLRKFWYRDSLSLAKVYTLSIITKIKLESFLKLANVS